MKPEQQQLAIAEACGWKDLETQWSNYHQWQSPDGVVKMGSLRDKYACLPDYLNDLNAMHEAEKIIFSLKGEDPIYGFPWSFRYAVELSKMELVGEVAKLHATAAQRAEAFLKTLNLWKP